MTNLTIAKLIALLSSLTAPVSPEALATAVEEAELGIDHGEVTDSELDADVNEHRAAAHARRDARRAARAERTNEHRAAAHARRDARKAARSDRKPSDHGLGLGRRVPVRPEAGLRNGRNLEAREIRAAASERLEARRAERTEARSARIERRNARAEQATNRGAERRESAMRRGAERRESARSGAMRGRGMR